MGGQVVLVSSEFNYLEVARSILFDRRKKEHMKLASSGKKADMPNAQSEASMRRKRLWRKLRYEPRRYFADSKTIGLPYLQYIFRK